MTRAFHAFAALLVSVHATIAAAEEAIVVQSTTSTANSGLYDHLLPLFTAATGIEVRVVAVGTGQAVRNARNCDGDVLLVHHREAEEQFVSDGFGTSRTDLMYNDFVIVGPPSDPAGVTASEDAVGAFAAIADMQAVFASRGDDSGTHRKERALWAMAGIAPDGATARWYRETGSGMGATLNAGVAMEAYILTDRATWVSFGNKLDHRILFDGDPALLNQYGVIPVSPEACPNVAAQSARRFTEWLVSEAGQAAIGAYRVAGEQLFVPNASARP